MLITSLNISTNPSSSLFERLNLKIDHCAISHRVLHLALLSMPKHAQNIEAYRLTFQQDNPRYKGTYLDGILNARDFVHHDISIEAKAIYITREEMIAHIHCNQFMTHG